MNERKMNFGKIAMVGGMIAMTAMLSAIMMTGCGCQQRAEKAISTADLAATADSAPNTTYSEEEQDVLDENLSIDAEGNIVDGSGKQLKVDDEGKVEIKNPTALLSRLTPIPSVKRSNSRKPKTAAALLL